MAKKAKTTDIRPTHFAVREMDRGDKGVLNRLFDEMDEEARQKLLNYALQLRRKPKPE